MTSSDQSQKEIQQVAQANIIQDILGHAEFAPTFEEIDYYNPARSTGEVEYHLNKLIENGWVGRRQPEGDESVWFYILTDEGYDRLHSQRLFLDKLDEIRDDFQRTEKTSRIEELETLPRPELETEYDLEAWT